MATCTNTPQQLGREVLLSWIPACDDLDPRTSANPAPAWKVLGFVSTSSFDRTMRTDTNNTEQSGAWTDTLVTGLDVSISASLEDNRDIADLTTQDELREYILNEVVAGRQPNIRLRKTDTLHNRYEYWYCMATDNSQAAESEARRTADFTFIPTASYDSTNPTYIEEAIN